MMNQTLASLGCASLAIALVLTRLARLFGRGGWRALRPSLRQNHHRARIQKCERHPASVISDFRRDADEICALLGYNGASSGHPLPTLRDDVSVPSSRVKKSEKGTVEW
jgi:hypothetical protein